MTKPNDWIVCINADEVANLTLGKTYLVKRVYDSMISVINDNGNAEGYFKHRFAETDNAD